MDRVTELVKQFCEVGWNFKLIYDQTYLDGDGNVLWQATFWHPDSEARHFAKDRDMHIAMAKAVERFQRWLVA